VFLFSPQGALAPSLLDLPPQPLDFLIMGVETLLEQLEPPLPAGPGGAGGLSLLPGRVYIGLGLVEGGLALGVMAFVATDLFGCASDPLRHQGQLTLDIVFLGLECLLLDGQPPMTNLNIVVSRLRHRQLLGELSELLLELARAATADRDHVFGAAELGEDRCDFGLFGGNLLFDDGQLLLASEQTGGRTCTLDMQHPRLCPDPLAADKGDARVIVGQALGVGGGVDQIGRWQRCRHLGCQAERVAQGRADGWVTDERQWVGVMPWAQQAAGSLTGGQGTRQPQGVLFGGKDDGVFQCT
jgi:hypothetical protein